MGEAARIRIGQDDIEGALDRAILEAGGDLRGALRAMALRQIDLEHRLATTVSAGYVRRGPVVG